MAALMQRKLDCRNWRLVLTGHSLGAGAAALIALHLSGRFSSEALLLVLTKLDRHLLHEAAEIWLIVFWLTGRCLPQAVHFEKAQSGRQCSRLDSPFSRARYNSF